MAQKEIRKASLFKEFQQINVPLCGSKIILQVEEGIKLNEKLVICLKDNLSKRMNIYYKNYDSVGEFANLFIGNDK